MVADHLKTEIALLILVFSVSLGVLPWSAVYWQIQSVVNEIFPRQPSVHHIMPFFAIRAFRATTTAEYVVYQSMVEQDNYQPQPIAFGRFYGFV